jgi:WD40 repeat protein
MVAVSPDGTKVASGGVDGQITIRSLAGDPAPVRLDGHIDIVWGGGWSPDGGNFISGGADRTVRIWDVATRRSTILGKHDTAVLTAAFSRDGRLALSSAADGVRVWDWRAGTVLFRPSLPGRVGYRASLSPDSSRLAVVTVDDSLRLYDCETCGSLDDVETLASERVTRQLTPDEEAAFGG